LNDVNHWIHQEGKGIDRLKIYLKNNKKICIELENLSNSIKNHEMVKQLKNFLIAKEKKKVLFISILLKIKKTYTTSHTGFQPTKFIIIKYPKPTKIFI
jgi:hypothetical protein